MTHFTRRRFANSAAALLASGMLGEAVAQEWPQRPIRIMVPYAAGGGLDAVTRPLANFLAARLGQPVLVENRAGASGTIGTAQVARAAPDGYSFVIVPTSPVVYARLLQKNLPYDPERDLVPVAKVGEFPLAIMINPQKVPARNLRELVAHAKANPGTLNVGNLGLGSQGHLTDLLIERVAGIKLKIVPYSSSAQERQDFLAGVLDVVAEVPTVYLPHIAQGQLRALAIMAPQRSDLLPDVPTTAEAGFPELQAEGWYALFAPRGTPREIVLRVSQAAGEFLRSAEARTAFRPLGVTPSPSTPEELQALVAREFAQWGPIIRSANITLE